MIRSSKPSPLTSPALDHRSSLIGHMSTDAVESEAVACRPATAQGNGRLQNRPTFPNTTKLSPLSELTTIGVCSNARSDDQVVEAIAVDVTLHLITDPNRSRRSSSIAVESEAVAWPSSDCSGQWPTVKTVRLSEHHVALTTCTAVTIGISENCAAMIRSSKPSPLTSPALDHRSAGLVTRGGNPVEPEAVACRPATAQINDRL